MMATLEEINKKLGFNIFDYDPKVSDYEDDTDTEIIFDVLTDEEVNFIIDYKLKNKLNK
ncbi:MAG: hypothetical protein E7L18_06800 [Finegoldia magna]|uniref:hypothetical protein n=1 Tax=Finegoldia magna TaxID=1260 RepID=UPI002911F259|nr:hypothetical protein [Finegoldia magna]MDU7331193.1 hypothetical protein [Finegoldia magna]